MNVLNNGINDIHLTSLDANSSTDSAITVRRHFGDLASDLETWTAWWLKRHAPQFSGPPWTVYELECGTIFLAPASPADGDAVTDEAPLPALSATAAGIAATLSAMLALCVYLPDSDWMEDQYECLKEFAVAHAEAADIERALANYPAWELHPPGSTVTAVPGTVTDASSLFAASNTPRETGA